MPRVSIVLPTYNAADYLAEMIDSALRQTFEDFEFLIIDSASSDTTAEIVRGYDDSRITFTELPFVCEGAIKRNLGISQATGDYIAMMDADDIMVPERLEKQVAFLDENPDIPKQTFLVMHQHGKFPLHIDNRKAAFFYIKHRAHFLF